MPDNFLSKDRLHILSKLKAKINDESLKSMLLRIWTRWSDILWKDLPSQSVRASTEEHNPGKYKFSRILFITVKCISGYYTEDCHEKEYQPALLDPSWRGLAKIGKKIIQNRLIIPNSISFQKITT